MNKVILMGRLTKDVELRYAQNEKGTAIGRYGLAVRKQFKRENEPDADFITIVAYGKAAEFAGKFFKKGQQVAIVGRLSIRSYDKDGTKQYVTEVIAEEQHFAESKKGDTQPTEVLHGEVITMEEEDDLPF